jgi:hypothetical protein
MTVTLTAPSGILLPLMQRDAPVPDQFKIGVLRRHLPHLMANGVRVPTARLLEAKLRDNLPNRTP